MSHTYLLVQQCSKHQYEETLYKDKQSSFSLEASNGKR